MNPMHPTTDLDRVLTEWLDEGPKRAPERPIQLAIEHARAHPRRPDPIWFMRTDAMTPRSFQIAFQPAFALMAVGLLLAAVVAVGVGSRGNDSQVPPLTPSPSAPPSATPSEPAESPSPTPPTIRFNEEITILGNDDQPTRVTVFELSGLLESIAQGDLQIGTDPDEDGLWAANAPGDDTVVHVVWGGCPSQDEYLITVDAIAGTVVVETSECTGDTVGITRAVALQFSEAVDAQALELTLREQNAVGPSDHPASPTP
jgi:hypothetical protein